MDESQPAHEHHSHPSRCCAEEDPQAVLDRLNRSPPSRMGYKTPHGWSGEEGEAYSARLSAWLQAVAREEMALRKLGRG